MYKRQALDVGRNGAGFEPGRTAREALIDDAAGEAPAPHDEAPRDTVNEDVACLHAEVQQ